MSVCPRGTGLPGCYLLEAKEQKEAARASGSAP